MGLIVRRLQLKNGRGREIIVLLGGGDKRTQTKDIKTAQRLWKEFADETAGLS